MVVSMLVNSLYNIVDSFFVAKISENAMTALSLVFPVQNLINAVMIGFGIGINAVISFYLGAADQKKADQAASQGMLLGTFHGILLMIICLVVISVFFAWELVFEKVFQAVGKMNISMICLMSGCLVNIFLDPVLIFGLGPFPSLGIEGAALATGLGQTFSAILYLIFYMVAPISVKFRRAYFKPDFALCKKMYSIGIPASLNMALPSLLISSLNVILAGFGQSYVFVLGVYYKLQTFLYLPANGVIQGMRPLIGYNYGAKEHSRVNKIYQTSLILVLAIMAVGTVLCLCIPGTLIHLFTATPATIKIGSSALHIICLGFLVSSVSVTSSGALEGLGMGLPSLIISLCRYTLIIIPLAFLLSLLQGASGVWHAFWITEAITAIISYWIYHRKVRAL